MSNFRWALQKHSQWFMHKVTKALHCVNDVVFAVTIDVVVTVLAKRRPTEYHTVTIMCVQVAEVARLHVRWQVLTAFCAHHPMSAWQ
jgi:hypothetical protein